MSTTFQVRNRTVVVAQCLLVGLALVWGLGLWRAYDSLSRDKARSCPYCERFATI